MLALKVPLKDAERWKRYLSDNDLFDHEYRFKKEDKHIYFPIRKGFKAKGMPTIVDIKLDPAKENGTLKEKLSEKLTKKEMELVKAAHDVIGNIAILEIPKGLEKKEKLIARTLLKANAQVKTVLKKAESHQGMFRTQKMKFLAGIDTREATYKENNVVLKLDVEKVYFSVRLSSERKRIAGQVNSGEEILVMFSGCAPYCVVLSKNTKAKHILGIEINPQGHRYGLENIRLNKCRNVELICADVHDVKLKQKFDRILMPLPKTADEFLDDALKAAKKGTIVHFYDFLEEGKFGEAHEKIITACRKKKMKCKILGTVKCGQHAPRIFRICVDFMVS